MRRLIVWAASATLALTAMACGQSSGGGGGGGGSGSADAGDVAPDTDSPSDDTTSGDDTTTPPPDTSSEDTATEDTASHDTGASDAGDAGPSCQIDDDNDGLTNCEEAKLCTDPTSGDTDGDGLSDFEEFQKYQSDPCKADTDNDSLEDGEEDRFGLDPTAPSTYNDGVLDGNRWFIDICQKIDPEPLGFHKSRAGNWLVALPPSFSNYTELTISNFTAPHAAAVYDDPANEVAGFTLSKKAKSGQSSPHDPLNNTVPGKVRSKVSSIDYNLLGPEFTTHDDKTAAILVYEVTADKKSSVRQIRDELLFGLGPFSRSDVSGLPNSSGSQYDEFRVEISVILRRHKSGKKTNLFSVAVAPLGKYQQNDKVKFRVDDLTNTTNVADAVDLHRDECATQPPGKQTPKTEFYWVLDQSGSMNDENKIIRQFASDFVKRIKNTRLDYRLGVTNAHTGNDGRLQVPPGWHTSVSIFKNQIKTLVENCHTQAPPGVQCGGNEGGIESAYEGLKYMLGQTAQPPAGPEKIRSGASVITVWMSDEAAQGSKHAQARRFYKENSKYVAFSMTTQTTGPNCQSGFPAPRGDYKQTALDSGGGSADLCSGNLKKTLRAIIRKAAELSTNFKLGKDPISSSLRVYVDGKWVPRSQDDGFDYSPRRNVLTFYGNARPSYNRKKPMEGPEWVAVAFETFHSKCKERGSHNTCSPPSP